MCYNWQIKQINVNNTFLNRDLSKKVYINQLEGFSDNTSKTKLVCKLNKALYGLKQAPRAWFEKLKATLLTQGFASSVADASLFIYKFRQVIVYILIYVNDILLIGNDIPLIDKIIFQLNCQFALKNLRSLHFFLGFEVTRSSTSLYLCQTKYFD